MEKAVNSVIEFLVSVVSAAFTAFWLAYIAHYNFGLSRQEIRTAALAAACVIAVLMAVEFFGKKLRKPK
jgi:Na+/melibiose symporter-like transporter